MSVFQARREIFLEVGVSEMCFNRAFRVVGAGDNLFYQQILCLIIEEKDLFGYLCGALDHCTKVHSEFLVFKVSTETGRCLSDTSLLVYPGHLILCSMYLATLESNSLSLRRPS